MDEAVVDWSRWVAVAMRADALGGARARGWDGVGKFVKKEKESICEECKKLE